MYYYAEILRGMRALRIVGLILGIVLVIAMILRVWIFAEHKPDFFAMNLQSSSTAHVTSKTLADGTVETTIDDPVQRVHAVVDRRTGYFHMEATVPSDRRMSGGLTLGDSSVRSDKKTGLKHIVLTEDMHGANLPVGVLFAVASIIALVTATMLGGVLAKENDGHLELAWTKPVSREKLALASIATDIVAIVVSHLMTVVLILLVCAMFVWPRFYTNSSTPVLMAIALLGPIAWYACLTGFSASLKRGLGMVCGLGWLAAVVIPGVAGGTLNSQSDIGRTIHAIFAGLSYIDPIAYLSFHGSMSGNGLAFRTAAGSLGFSASMLAVLSIVYIALAVLQWRRVEA